MMMTQLKPYDVEMLLYFKTESVVFELQERLTLPIESEVSKSQGLKDVTS
jgi:hypothetical protein